MDTGCKFTLCVLRTQSGKTFTAVSRIMSEIERDGDEGQGKSIHLVWTMNTLLNNSQFSNRLKPIQTKYGGGSVVVFASKYEEKEDESKYTHVKTLTELKGICMDLQTCPRVIVMCSNGKRFKDGFNFINILNSNTTNLSRVFAYYDELHHYINDKLRDQIEGIDDMNIVKGILAMTATPENILLKTGYWASVQMIDLGVLNEDNYVGHKDMHFIMDDYFPGYRRPCNFNYDQLDDDVVHFVTNIIDKYPDILKRGSRTFIPAHKRRIGHKRIRDEIFARCPDAVVVMLNGEEKNMKCKDFMYFKDKGEYKVIDLVSNKEVCDTMATKIKANKLKDRPFVVTGFLCVGMGQTLMHESLGNFTSAILSHLDLTNDDLYQLFGRLTGRCKHWKTYVTTDVYTTPISRNRMIAMEECARSIAVDYNGKIVTEEEYRAPLAKLGVIGEAVLENMREKKEKKIKKVKPEISEHQATTLKEIDDFLTKTFKKPIQVRSFIQIKGYTISTRMVTYYHKTKNQLDATDRLTKECYDKIKMAMNISSKQDSGQPYMVYPVYETMESKEFKYYLRYLNKG